MYKEERVITTILVQQKMSSGNTAVGNEFGISAMNVKEMNTKLKERNLHISCLNAVLIACLLDHFWSNLEHDPEADEIPTFM